MVEQQVNVRYLKGLKTTLSVWSILEIAICIFLCGCITEEAIKGTFKDQTETVLSVAIPLLIMAIALSSIDLFGVIKENLILIKVSLFVGLVELLSAFLTTNILGLMGGLIRNGLFYWYHSLVVEKLKLMEQLKCDAQMNV